MIIPESFINSVVCIGDIKNGIFSPIGTGFIVGRRASEGENNFFPYLVTNKHVLCYFLSSCNSEMAIRLYEKETHQVKLYKVDKDKFSISDNSNIDIAVAQLDGEFLSNQVERIGLIDLDRNIFTSTEFIDNGGGCGTLIYMLGFPMKLIEDNSCTPLCRIGCVSRIDTEEIQNSKRILLDIQNFPGNSGSPIFCRAELASVDGTKPVQKTALIGIVNSYIPYSENLINAQTNQVVEVRTENSGIAIANPAEYIKDLIEQDLKSKNLN